MSLSSGAFPLLPLSTSFGIAREAGADGIELLLTPRLVRVQPERIHALETDHGIPVLSVHTVLRLGASSHQQAASDIIASARLARDLPSCEALVIHTPSTDRLHSPAAIAWLEAVRLAQEIAPRVAMAIENSGALAHDEPEYVASQPETFQRLIEEWGFDVTFDTAHAASRGGDIFATLDRLLPHLRNVHLSDYGRRSYPLRLANALVRDHRLPGTGILPIPQLLRQLAGAGYTGLVTLELSPIAVHAWWLPSARRRIARAVAACREHLPGGAVTEQRARRPGHAPFD